MKSEFFWNKTNFKILKYRKRPNTGCGNVLPACTDQETFSRGVLCIILFSREEGGGGVGGLFSKILRCEFNRFEFNKFPPPPNKATHGICW